MMDYWPQLSMSQSLIKNWVDANGTPTGYMKTYRTSLAGDYNLVDLDKGLKWVDTWNYRLDPNRGVLETGDQFASGGNVSFAPKGEIFWGNTLSAPVKGQTQFECQSILMTGKKPTAGYFQCIGIKEVIPKHTVKVGNSQQTFANVLKLVVVQKTSVEIHAVYYLAPAVGFVQIDYYDDAWKFAGSWFAKSICLKGLKDWKCE